MRPHTHDQRTRDRKRTQPGIFSPCYGGLYLTRASTMAPRNFSVLKSTCKPVVRNKAGADGMRR